MSSSPLPASLPSLPSPSFPRWPRSGCPGPPVAAAPRAYRPSGSGLGVSAEGSPAPPALSPEARRLRRRGRGCFWAASSGSMERTGGLGVGRWPGARQTRWDGHRARPLLPGEQILSGGLRHRRRHLPGFENGGRAAASQSGDSGRLLGNVRSRPAGAEADTGKHYSGRPWVSFVLGSRSPKVRFLPHGSSIRTSATGQGELEPEVGPSARGWAGGEIGSDDLNRDLVVGHRGAKFLA